jgi:histidine triad (HIT) family protein
MPTIFSKIVAGEISCHKVWEDERHLAFLDINPWTYGHTLVIPKREQDYLWDMPEDEFVALQRAAQAVAQLLKTKLQCSRVCSMVVGYEIPHVHIHLLPTNQMSDFIKPGTMGMKEKPDFAEILKKLGASSEVTKQFAEAFNKRDVATLKSLYAGDATAQVIGSPFPEERGVEDIAKKSLNHMLDEDNPLTACAGQLAGRALVLFRDQTGKLDVAAYVTEQDGKIKRMEYIVSFHRADELNLIDLKMRVGK